MSTDKAVTKDLMTVLEDGREGFHAAADKLESTDRADLASTFRRLGDQRGQFHAELQEMARAYGDAVDEGGSVAGTLHRGWMAVKDALAGSDPHGVLDAAEQGEDHAVETYEKALTEDLSVDLRGVVERQLVAVRAAHDEVRALRDTAG
ncbi:MAG: PA2169 family four-helix-bundle protein [Acidimicrobiales bacterium]|nr:PA2169 family four-helix-bundle protein [Acidimicrobiales bacterium]